MAAVIGNRYISLGVMGNRLITVCAGFGGDVFGCSPYDAATTRYLKATYPSYWAQIRDYGFVNPQLVPWINEDNDLIVSLVSVGKRRYARIPTNAYAWTGEVANQDTFMSFKGKLLTNKSGSGEKWNTLFAADASAGTRAFGFWANDTSGNGTLVQYNNRYAYYSRIDLNRDFYAEMDKNIATIRYQDEETPFINVVGNYSAFTTPSEVGLFMLIRNGSPISGYDGWFDGLFSESIIKQNGVLARHFYPFERNGQMELLDIVTGTLATRVGTFTELIE